MYASYEGITAFDTTLLFTQRHNNLFSKRHTQPSHLQQRPRHSKPILKNVADKPLAYETIEISRISCRFIRKLYIKFHTVRYKSKRRIVIARLQFIQVYIM
jgi:hypothetical protein